MNMSMIILIVLTNPAFAAALLSPPRVTTKVAADWYRAVSRLSPNCEFGVSESLNSHRVWMDVALAIGNTLRFF